MSQKIVKIQKPNEIRVDAITPNIIEIISIPQFDKNGFKQPPLKVEDIDNLDFSITSTTDINYISSVKPIKKYFKSRVIYAPITSIDLRIAQRVYLQLDKPLQDDNNYTINMNDNLYNYKYSQNRVSKVIHLDSEGYLPNDKKRAFVGMQLGDFEVELQDLSFVVKRTDTREVVYSGIGKVQKSLYWRENFINLDRLYQHVVEFDFSDIDKSGEYILENSELGISG